jgi:hypothetical protein
MVADRRIERYPHNDERTKTGSIAMDVDGGCGRSRGLLGLERTGVI